MALWILHLRSLGLVTLVLVGLLCPAWCGVRRTYDESFGSDSSEDLDQLFFYYVHKQEIKGEVICERSKVHIFQTNEREENEIRFFATLGSDGKLRVTCQGGFLVIVRNERIVYPEGLQHALNYSFSSANVSVDYDDNDLVSLEDALEAMRLESPPLSPDFVEVAEEYLKPLNLTVERIDVEGGDFVIISNPFGLGESVDFEKFFRFLSQMSNPTLLSETFPHFPAVVAWIEAESRN